MVNQKILVTGSSGLIGGEVVNFFSEMNYKVIGIDNNMREIFFGKKGSTLNNLKRLETENVSFTNFNIFKPRIFK